MLISVYNYLKGKSEQFMFYSTVVLLVLSILPITMCLPLFLRHILQLLAMLGFFIGIVLNKDRKLLLVYCLVMAVFFLQIYQVWRFNKKSFSSVAFSAFTDWSFVFYGLALYKLKNTKLQKYLLNGLFIAVTLTAVTTIIGLFADPLAVRELGRSDLSYSYTGVTGKAFAEIKWGYRIRNIAGWNQLYGMAFVIPCLLFVYKKTKKWIYLAGAVICTLCVIKAQLMFALLLTGMMILFSFVKPSFKRKPLMIEGGILVLAVLFIDDLILLASNLTAKLGMSMLPKKLHDFYLLLHGTDTGSALARTNVYSRALDIIKEHPLLGRLFYGVNKKVVFSYHSDVLDLLAFFGLLIGGVVIIGCIYMYIRYILSIEHSDKWLVILLLFGFMIMAILNPVWYSPQVYTAVFLMPALIANLYNKSECK